MILADKIIRLRKKNGWSQEELADKVNVSRQAVSKWEGAQTVPDLDKILALSVLFGVTTDYLLKDELEDEEFTESDNSPDVHKVSLSEANNYMESRRSASLKIAFATFLCIISPITLIILATAQELALLGVREAVAITLGISVMFILIAGAVSLFLLCGFKNSPYEYLNKSNSFELEYGVKGLVTERKKAYKNTYALFNIIGTCICLLSVLPIILSSFSENEILIVSMLGVTMACEGVGVMFFITAGVRQASFNRLLCEADFTEKNKKLDKFMDMFDTVYWLVVTAAYLGVSFLTAAWHITWIIWPVAAILNAVVENIVKYTFEKDKINKK